MPSIRTLVRVAGALGALGFAGLAAAQSPNPGAGLGLGTRIATRFGVGFVINLLLAGALVGLAPQYARETVGELRESPGEAFVWGLLVGIGVPILLGLLAITIIGLLITIPGLIAIGLLALVGNAISVAWLGTVATGRDRPDGTAAAVGALAVSVAFAIPVLRDLVASLVGFFGLGVAGRRLYRSWRG
jgi:hypothetical protein